MKQFHISQAHERIGMNDSLPFWISMIKESQKVLKPEAEKNVLDFGCGDGTILVNYKGRYCVLTSANCKIYKSK